MDKTVNININEPIIKCLKINLSSGIATVLFTQLPAMEKNLQGAREAQEMMQRQLDELPQRMEENSNWMTAMEGYIKEIKQLKTEYDAQITE